MTYSYKLIKSPVGELKLIASGTGLVAIIWKNDDPSRVRLGPLVEDPSNPILLETKRQLREYFSGKLTTFSIPLDFKGTDFLKQVWTALLTIPFGETRSYGQIARQVGRPTAYRAVGSANGKNPIAIVAPCHRVIGSTGKLVGFAGGLEAKELLLAMEERKHVGADPRSERLPPATFSPDRSSDQAVEPPLAQPPYA